MVFTAVHGLTLSLSCPRILSTDVDTSMGKNLHTDLRTFPGVSRALRRESSAISHTR
jgi:hypothetical protein